MSISSSSSQVDDPAYKVYSKFKGEEEDAWDGDVFLQKTPPEEIHGDGDEIDGPPPPPYIVLVQGPPNVGKSLLIDALVQCFSGECLSSIRGQGRGPITIITDKGSRLQFLECPDDIDGMIDAAKYADLVLLAVDASYGYEAETFEFLNLLEAHGAQPVMGVFTNLHFKDGRELNETITRLRDHFWGEICPGAIISYLCGPGGPELDLHTFQMVELQKLAEHILMHQSHSSSWRAPHPYVLVDRIEDVTPLEKVHEDAHCKRNISLYGHLRGCNIKSRAKVHLAGVGDFRLADVRSTTDPFSLSSEMEMGEDFVELAHMESESFRTGTYLRLEVHDVPYQVVQNDDPCHPILIGGIGLEEEESVGYVQARLERHSWHMKLLKSADPVTVSAGWRRYQTKPIYANNGRHVILKFNPEHQHCLAMFRGPLAPPGTRIAVVHGTKEVFRIAAKAVVLDPKSKIMKEVKQKGTPCKILEGKKTALIKFIKFKRGKNIDVAEFEGSRIRTRSGIWGKVDKAEERKGIARCTFEKRICKRDTFIMPVYRQVVAPPFYEPCYSNKFSLNEGTVIEQRRRVEIIDEEPCSHPDSCYFMLSRNINYKDGKRKKPVVVMSKEKRKTLLMKQHKKEFEILSEIGC